MIKYEFILKNEDDLKLLKLLSREIEGFTHRHFLDLLKNKDIKVNGKRIQIKETLSIGDKIEVFVNTDLLNKKKQICTKLVKDYKDIAIYFKPRGIGSEDFSKLLCGDLILAHRLDTNTEGLLIFAKSQPIFEELKHAFKNNYVIKKYLAVVYGEFKLPDSAYSAYLKKDSEKSEVKIYKTEISGSLPIVTTIKAISKTKTRSILELGLITGRTHQLRAHLAFLKYPILGDTKYGDFYRNKKEGITKQQLTAYKLSFNFPEAYNLSYLNKETIEIRADFQVTGDR